MRRLPLILGLVLIVALMIHDVYEFFVTNEGVRCFSSEPHRPGYVLLLGIAGGMVALAISRLSPASQRNLKLAALGGFGIFLTGMVGALTCVMLAAQMVPQNTWGWVIAAWLGWTVVAGLVWLEFRQVWRRKR